MELKEKISLLASGGKYDVCSSSCAKPLSDGNMPPGICHSFTPDGRCVSLFRVLMTNKCSGDCKYCPNSCDRRTKRTELGVEEYVRTYKHFHDRNLVEGLFLSSGIMKDEDATMERMVEIVENLRYRHGIRDYVHLKVIPGSSRDMIDRAAFVADRLSVNIEAPSASRFSEMSSTKDFRIDILRRMEWMAQIERRGNGMRAGHTTQFVVGASSESDMEIVGCMERIYGSYGLRRCYFSAFNAIPGTVFEKHPKTPLLREHRLYEVDFLLRDYDFKMGDIFFDDRGNLSLKYDPKFLYALEKKGFFPLDINRASFNELLRVPGIGPRSARRIMAARGSGFKFSRFSELRNVGVVMKRAHGFLEIDNKVQRRLSDAFS